MRNKNIPAMLDILGRFCVAASDKVPKNILGQNIASNRPEQWAELSDVLPSCDFSNVFPGILMQPGPLVCLDLDNHEDDPEVAIMLEKIVNEFKGKTYIERSMSGKGYHIFLLYTGEYNSLIFEAQECTSPGKIHFPWGQLFCSGQYVALTGDAIEGSTPGLMVGEDADNYLDALIRHSGKPVLSKDEELETLAGKHDGRGDEIIIENMLNHNPEHEVRLKLLWEGKWSAAGYPSQSEADFAMVNAIASFTKYPPQILSIFEKSGLVRPKTYRGGYFNHMMVKALGKEFEKKLSAHKMSMALLGKPIETIQSVPNIDENDPDEEDEDGDISEVPDIMWPQGALGDLAQFAMDLNVRPSSTVSIASALSLMSLIAAPYTTLDGQRANLFISVVGPSSAGKNVVHRLPDQVLSSIFERTHMFDPLRATPIPPDITGMIRKLSASAQGINKAQQKYPDLLLVDAEMGTSWEQLSGASSYSSSNVDQMRSKLLDSFSRSGAGMFDQRKDWADTDKETKPIAAPYLCYTGETTVEQFYRGVTDKSIEGGLVQRFLCFRIKPGQWRDDDTMYRPTMPDGAINRLIQLFQRLAFYRQPDVTGKIPSDLPPSYMTIGYENDSVRREMNDWRARYADGVHGKQGELLKRVALIHAIGRGALTIASMDVAFAKSVCQHSMSVVSAHTENKEGDFRKAVTELVAEWRSMSKLKRRKAWGKAKTPLIIKSDDRVILRRWMVNRVQNRHALWGGRRGNIREINESITLYLEGWATETTADIHFQSPSAGQSAILVFGA